MPISMMRGTWSDGLRISGWSVCQPNPVLLGGRKTRSMTELVSRGLSANLVGPGFEEGDNSRPRLSAIVIVRATGHKLQENPQLILQLVVMIQLTSRRILRD